MTEPVVDWRAIKQSITDIQLPRIHRTDVRCGHHGCGRWCITAFDSADKGLWVVFHVDLPHMNEAGATWQDAVTEAVLAVEQLRQPATGNRRHDLARLWALTYAMRGLAMLAPGMRRTGTIQVRHITDDAPTLGVEGTCDKHHRIVGVGIAQLRAAVRSNDRNLKPSAEG